MAEVDGEVVGTVGAGPGEFEVSTALTALWVDPRARGQGVGTALIEAVEEWARGEGCERVLLWVTAVNETAERLYRRRGYVRTGRVTEVRPGEPGIEYEMSKRV